MEKVNHANANRPEMARMQEFAAAGKKQGPSAEAVLL